MSIALNIDALVKEYNIDRELVVEAMKDAVKAAARKQFKIQDKSGDSLVVDWSPEMGTPEITVMKTVVDDVQNPTVELSLQEAQELAGDEIELGDMLGIPLPAEDLGRIAAQTAKQILVQKVREAVRENIYEQYIDKVGDLINGVVKRFERGDMIVDLGTMEALLPKNEQVRMESWNQGERIRVVIERVTKDPKGQQIIVSRTSPELIKRLFEMEVPEIYDETVMIKSAVREPGERAKIAVASNEKDVDPVGACVGMKGSRVQSIIRELRNEKIDIIEWSDEPSVFAANALSPAKVTQVRITDIENRRMEVIVNEDQLSLAIGKKGQNVRLATKLVQWNIDIRNEKDLRREITLQMGKTMAFGGEVPLSAVEGLTAAQAEELKSRDITDIDKLAALSLDELVDALDISLDDAERISNSANSILAARTEAAETETPTAESPKESSDDANQNVADETSAEEPLAETIETEQNADNLETDDNNSGEASV